MRFSLMKQNVIAFVKIADKTLLHKEFRGISVRSATVLRDLCDLRSCWRNQNLKKRGDR